MGTQKLKAPVGARREKKCLGRGSGCGRDKSAGRGNKGQNARSGGGVRLGFEGGQMPLFRRIAYRGFSNFDFAKKFTVVNLGLLENKYSDGETVDRETLIEKGLVKKSEKNIKLLGTGNLSKKLHVKIEKFSAGVRAKVEKAGGTIVTPDAGADEVKA